MMVNKLLMIIVGTFIGHWIADKLDNHIAGGANGDE